MRSIFIFLTILARFDLEITYKKSVSIGFSYQYNSKMDNIDAIFMDPLFESIIPGIPASMERLNHSFHLFDARIRFRLYKGITLAILAENIFNTEYLVRTAYFGSPRSFMAQMKVEF